jgi:hypothetical protein
MEELQIMLVWDACSDDADGMTLWWRFMNYVPLTATAHDWILLLGTRGTGIAAFSRPLSVFVMARSTPRCDKGTYPPPTALP